jgi:hypothetical protein
MKNIAFDIRPIVINNNFLFFININVFTILTPKTKPRHAAPKAKIKYSYPFLFYK